MAFDGNPRDDLRAEYVREALDYNPATGEFVWRERPEHHFKNSRGWAIWNGRYSGSVAGKYLKSKGKHNTYHTISINKKQYMAHRLAWLLVHGKWPNHFIDHINGNSLDNRIENLRDVDAFQNQRNTRLNAGNLSGVMGVSRKKICGNYYWIARICGGRAHGEHLYCGQDFFEAICARKSAELKYSFHPNHGRTS